MKSCSECGEEKPLSDFYWRNDNKTYRANCKECVKARTRAWRAADPQRSRAAVRAYKQRNEAAVKARIKRWRAENKDRVLMSNQKRRHMLAQLPYENVDRKAVYERDRGICHICRRHVSPKRFALDHLIPMSHGGGYTYDNLRLAHPRCNSRRHDGRLPAQLLLLG